MNNSVIFIEEDGTVCGLASPVTRLLGLSDRRRVSHVEPVNRTLRWLFHAIRKRVKDNSAIAEFTRRWPCRWQARVFDGPVLGPFLSRQSAIAAEIAYINTQLEGLHDE